MSRQRKSPRLSVGRIKKCSDVASATPGSYRIGEVSIAGAAFRLVWPSVLAEENERMQNAATRTFATLVVISVICNSLCAQDANEASSSVDLANKKRILAFEAPSLDSEPLNIGTRRELFVDNYLIGDLRGGAERHLFEMTPATTELADVAMTCDEDWEGPWCRYSKFIQDKDGIKVWYMGHHTYDYKDKEGNEAPGRLCYAFSKDGLTFEKPNLGLFEWLGSTANNVLFNDRTFKAANGNWLVTHNFSPFIDTNPAVPPEARYKAFSGYGERLGGNTGLYAWQSADGLHWEFASDGPIVNNRHRLDSPNQGFWDTERKRYAVYLRHLRNSEGEEGYPVPNWRRDIRVAFSDDFIRWTEPQWLVYHRDDGQPGMDLTHLYTNEIKPYKRAPHIYLGFPSRFVNFAPMLIASRDGVHFYRWMERPLIPQTAPAGRQKNRSNHIWQEMVELPGEPDKYSMYCSENLAISGSHPDGSFPRFRRFTIRKDGFVSVRAGGQQGELTTRPLIFAGDSLTVNYDAQSEEAGELRIELLDERRHPIPGFTSGECDPLTGDEIDSDVTWNGIADVSSLAGHPVHVRFVLSNADVFSFRFVE